MYLGKAAIWMLAVVFWALVLLFCMAGLNLFVMGIDYVLNRLMGKF